VIRLLDPYGLIIDQHLHRLPPEPRIDREAEVVEPNVARLPDQAVQLTESAEAPQATRINHAPCRTSRTTSGER
jgi:hypothetical protein